MRTLASGIAMLALLAAGPQPGHAQEPVNLDILAAAPYLVVEGDDLPRYVLVDAFYARAFTFYAAGDEAFRMNLLDPLGVRPGSGEARVLEQAVLLARALLVDPGAESQSDGLRDDRAIQAHRARELGSLFRDMTDALTAAGGSATSIEVYLDERIRPALQVFTTDATHATALDALDRVEAIFLAAYEAKS